MNKNKLLLAIVPEVVGVLGVLLGYDVVSLWQNFYYKQKKPLIDFVPGGGFILIFCFLLLAGVILQFILFRFLYKIKGTARFLIVITAVAIFLIFFLYIFSKSFSMGVFLSPGFLLYSLLNYATHKKLSSS
ncbi:MAG: hypothetical protein M3O71_31630 [Bacteroidota bacterium]|nr:hypothetical protein [Bacteroidota bacterium]